MAPNALQPHLQDAIDAAKQGGKDGERLFKEAVAKTADAAELDTLSRELLDMEERKEISLSLALRDTMRLRLKELHQTQADLVKLDTRLHLKRLTEQTMFHDISETVSPVARKTGEAISTAVEKMGEYPKAGPIIRDIAALFGINKAERSRNIEKTVGKGIANGFWKWCSNLNNGDEKSLFTGWLVKKGKDSLLKAAVKEAIDEAIATEREADTEKKTEERQNNIVFNGIDNYMWKKLTTQQKNVDWKEKAHACIEAIRKTNKTVGTTAGKPILVSLRGMMDMEKDKKIAEKKNAQEKQDAVKNKWNLDEKATVKFEGNKVMAKKESGVWNLTFPAATHLDDAGTPVHADAKLLETALKNADVQSALQEVEIGGAAWEIRKTATGLSMALPAGDEPILPRIADIMKKFAAQNRGQSFRVDRAGIMPKGEARIDFAVDGGIPFLRWNDVGDIAKVPSFFDDAGAALLAATPPAAWKSDPATGRWIAA